MLNKEQIINHFVVCWADACATQYEARVVNIQTTTSAFHKIVWQLYWTLCACIFSLCIICYSVSDRIGQRLYSWRRFARDRQCLFE